MSQPQCTCGNPAASACRRQQCGRCCMGCDKHAWKLPVPGEPGSCECGNVASPACDSWLCANCCSGCSRHCFETDESCSEDSYHAPAQPYYSTAPQPGEPGSCSCGQIASPQCDNLLCANCCNGCSRHAYEESESAAAPRPGEPGSCGCGQVASPSCDHLLCASCCNGCSRHAHAETEEESEAGPAPGEPGSCSCGQTASPQCDNHLCGSCCAGCSRHVYADTADEQESEQEQYQPQLQPQQQQQLLCVGCGRQAARHCDLQRCRNCCAALGAAACMFHENRVQQVMWDFAPEPAAHSAQTEFAAAHWEESTDGYDESDYGELLFAAPPQQQQQQQQGRCVCGQAAALTCTQGRCASCCDDLTCRRHGVSYLEPVGAMGLMTELAMSGLAEALMGYGLVTLPSMRQVDAALGVFGRPPSAWAPTVPAGAVPVAAGTPDASAAAAAAADGNSAGAGSSTGAGRSDTAGARDVNQQGAAAAAAGTGASSSSASGLKAGMPASEAEEALLQLKHCVVCLDEPRSVLLLPCKHLVLCAGCMVQMQRHVRQVYNLGNSDERDVKCPVCREPAASMLPGIILS